jgi:hypothetical protein
MSNILIGTEVDTWITDEADPTDSWSRDSTDGRVTNVWASYTDEEPRSWGESIIIPEPENFNGTLFAVVADYSSGDTFGRDGGHSQVLDAFADNETAEALAYIALEHKRDGWRVDYDYSFTFRDKEYRRDWWGYFESLNSLDVWEIQVKKYPRDPYEELDSYYEDEYPGIKAGRKVGR